MSQSRLGDLIANIRMRNYVHVRLALTRDESGTWLGRSLIADVYPDVWADHSDNAFADFPYKPPSFLKQYRYALFYAGFVPAAMVADWLTYPEDCALSGFDRRPGYLSKVVHFRLPALHEQTNSAWINSSEADSFALLPWPHTSHRCMYKDPISWQRSEDMQPLAADGEDHYDDFYDARAQLIHDTLYRTHPSAREDAVEIREVDGIGWIEAVTGSGHVYTVTLGGLGLTGCRLHLKSGASAERSRSVADVSEPTVRFSLDSIPQPPLTFVLVRNDRELDQKKYTPSDEQAEHSDAEIAEDTVLVVAQASQPKINVVTQPATTEPTVLSPTQTTSAPPTSLPRTPTTNKGTRSRTPRRKVGSVRTLRVVVASPSDVPRERKSLEGVVSELNDNQAGDLGLHLKLVKWETDSYPDFHVDGPQGLIDEILRIEEADIVIGIFWTHFGTPVKDAQSGTEHELQKAYEAWQKHGHPHTMVYFNKRVYQPKNRAELAQLDAVYAFQERFRDIALYSTYPNAAKFPDIVRQDLQKLLRKHYGKG